MAKGVRVKKPDECPHKWHLARFFYADLFSNAGNATFVCENCGKIKRLWCE